LITFDPTWLFAAAGVALVVVGSWLLVKGDGYDPRDRQR
jgi:type IV secretory pathway TrbD component